MSFQPGDQLETEINQFPLSANEKKCQEGKRKNDLIFANRVRERVKSRLKSMHVRFQGRKWWRVETLLVLAAIAVGLLSSYLSEARKAAREEQLRSTFQPISFVSVNQDISPGTVLNLGMLSVGHGYASQFTDNMLPQEEIDQIVGRRLIAPLKRGDPVLLTLVEGIGSQNSLASKIPAGRRFITLPISDRVASRGWIQPNDHVDVIANIELPDRGKTAFTLLQDVTVVSVGEATVWGDGASTHAREIGFFVSPKEVEFINFAQEKGVFSLALRNPRDIARQDSDGVNGDPGRSGVSLNEFLDHGSVLGASGGGELPVYVNGQKVGQGQER